MVVKKISTFAFLSLLFAFSDSSFAKTLLSTKLPDKRGPASFSQGYKIVNQDCAARKTPSMEGQATFTMPMGKRVWMTAMDSQWFIAKTQKAQEVYIPTTCVN